MMRTGPGQDKISTKSGRDLYDVWTTSVGKWTEVDRSRQRWTDVDRSGRIKHADMRM